MVSGPPPTPTASSSTVSSRPRTPTANDVYPSHASSSLSITSSSNAVTPSERLQSLLATGGPSTNTSLPDQINYLLFDELANTSLLLSKHRASLWSSLLENPLRSLERSDPSTSPKINSRELREGLGKFEKELTGRYHEQMEILQRSLRRRAEAAVVEWEESLWGRVLEHVQELENRVERTQSVMKKPIPLPDVQPQQGAWKYDELVLQVQQLQSRVGMLTEERARLEAEVAEERQRAKSFENAYQAASDGLGDLRQELRLQGVVANELRQQLEEERERRRGLERALGEERQESRVLKQTLTLKGHGQTHGVSVGVGEAVFKERDVRDMEDEVLALRDEVRRYQDMEAYERDRGEVRMAGRRRAESLYEEEDRRARAAHRDSKERLGRGSPRRSEQVANAAQQVPKSSRSASHSHARRGSYDSAAMLQSHYPLSAGPTGAFDTNSRHVQFATGI